MPKTLRISPITAILLNFAAGALGNIDPDPGTDGPVDLVIAGVASAVRDLANAGAPDSDQGRTVSVAETRSILSYLVIDLDKAAALVPADLVSVPVPVWSRAVLSGVGALLGAGDGVVGVIGAALRALGDAVADGVVDAHELRAVITAIRAAAEDAA